MFNENLILTCLIIISSFSFGLFVGKFNQPIEKIDNFIINEKIVKTIKNRNELPYGYTMETNGEKFAYITDAGTRNIFPNNSLEKEIKAAWSYYEYKNKQSKETWKSFELGKDKN